MKRTKKGFTLVELMVVMAISTILLVAVMTMTTPASRMYRSTAVSNDAYSMANNIDSYLKRSLEYADNVWLFDSATEAPEFGSGAMATNIENVVVNYKNAYYKNAAVATKEGADGDLKFVKGKIYVLHLDNNTGKIERRTYEFPNSSTNTVNLISTDADVVNTAYFLGDNQNYHIRYAFNSAKLEPKKVGGNIVHTSKGDFVFDLSSIGSNVSELHTNQAVSIIVNKGTSPTDNIPTDASIQGPASVTVANLPFVNISSRTGGNVPQNRIVIQNEGDATFYIQGQAGIPAGIARMKDEACINFAAKDTAHNNVSLEKDLYIVYSYADELVKHS